MARGFQGDDKKYHHSAWHYINIPSFLTIEDDSEVSGHLRGHITESEAPPIQLTERYLKAGGALSEQRVIEAGYRLGAVLREITKAN